MVTPIRNSYCPPWYYYTQKVKEEAEKHCATKYTRWTAAVASSASAFFVATSLLHCLVVEYLVHSSSRPYFAAASAAWHTAAAGETETRK